MPSTSVLPVGKLPNELLGRLLRRYALLDRRVVLGPGIGEDACAIQFGKRLLVAKTDPITFVAEDLGRYALVINSNDIATRGARPRWFLATLLLPEGKTTEAAVEGHFRDIWRACRELGVSLVGGHVEVTHGIDRPIVAGFLLGEVERGKLLSTAGARCGDDLVLTKGIAIEAVSVLAREKAEKLSIHFPSSFLRRCRGFSRWLSVLPEARVARSVGVHAMHDPTEGGLATALYEMAEASGNGLEVDAAAVPVPEEARILCEHFGLDPWGAIASGALLIACPPARTRLLLNRLRRARIPAARIGRFLPERSGVTRIRRGRCEPVPRFARDEIAKLFQGADERLLLF